MRWDILCTASWYPMSTLVPTASHEAAEEEFRVDNHEE